MSSSYNQDYIYIVQVDEQQNSDLDPQLSDGKLEVRIIPEVVRHSFDLLHDGGASYVDRESMSTQETSCTFDLGDFYVKPYTAYTTLLEKLTFLEIDQQYGDRISRSECSLVEALFTIMHQTWACFLCANIKRMHRVYIQNDGYLINRARRDSMVELERRNHGRVPASQAPQKRLLKRVKVKGESQSCTICLEGLKTGSYATSIPCSHLFHGECIIRWLQESHYCPVCRFEMPND